MEQQEANYKVNIDTADLQSQLANIRTMLDQTFQAQMLTADIPNPQPQSFAFPSQGFDNAIGAVSQDISGAQTGVGKALSSLGLGMQKFRENALDALMSPGPSFGSPMPSDRYIPDFKQMGAFQSLGASAFGFGYDPKMSMTRGAYKEKASEQFGHEALGLGLDLGFGGVGSILGKLGGSAAVGGIVGVATGMLAKPVLDATLLYDYNTTNEIKSYARDTSWRFLSGKFSREDASKVGVELSTVQRSSSMVGDRVGASDVQRLLGEYTEAGAFDYVRSAEEYASKAKRLIENHRKVMQILRVSEQEAVAAWSQVGTVEQAAALQGMAYTAGMTSSELMQWGNNAVEMVRGTGINFMSARQGAYQTITDVTSMLASGSISSNLALQMGGVQGIAGYMQQTGYQWGMSSQGFAQFAAAGAYNGDFKSWVSASPYETMGAAIGQVRTIGDYLENMGGRAETMSKMSPEVMYGMQGLQYLKEMQFLTGNGELIGGLNQNKFVGWMSQKYGMSDPQARLMWSTMTSQDDPTITTMFQRAEAVKNTIDMQAGITDRFKDNVGNFFGGISSVFTKPAMNISNNLSSMYEEGNNRMKEYFSGDRYSTVTQDTAKKLITNLKIRSEDIKKSSEDVKIITDYAEDTWNKSSKGQKFKRESDEHAALGFLKVSGEFDERTIRTLSTEMSKYDSYAAFKSEHVGTEITEDTFNLNKKLGLEQTFSLVTKVKGDINRTRALDARSRRSGQMTDFGVALNQHDESLYNSILGLRGDKAGYTKIKVDSALTAGLREFGLNKEKDGSERNINGFTVGLAVAAPSIFGGLISSNLPTDKDINYQLNIMANATNMADDEGVKLLKDKLKMSYQDAKFAMSSEGKARIKKLATFATASSLFKDSSDAQRAEDLDKQFNPLAASSEQLGILKESFQLIAKNMGAGDKDFKDLAASDPAKATLAVEMMNAQSLKQVATYFNAWASGTPMPVYLTK